MLWSLAAGEVRDEFFLLLDLCPVSPGIRDLASGTAWGPESCVGRQQGSAASAGTCVRCAEFPAPPHPQGVGKGGPQLPIRNLLPPGPACGLLVPSPILLGKLRMEVLSSVPSGSRSGSEKSTFRCSPQWEPWRQVAGWPLAPQAVTSSARLCFPGSCLLL